MKIQKTNFNHSNFLNHFEGVRKHPHFTTLKQLLKWLNLGLEYGIINWDKFPDTLSRSYLIFHGNLKSFIDANKE